MVEPNRTGSPSGCRPGAVALAIFLGSLSILFLALAGAILLLVYQFTHAGGNLTSGIGDTVQAAGKSVSQSALSAIQSVVDVADPLHPPRYPIHQDPEFDELRSISARDTIGDSRLYNFTVVAVEQRSEGGVPAELVYVRIHRRLIVPDVTKILGVTIRTDDQPKDYALYRGQEFGLGGHAYKVNWLSIENQTVEIVRFRQAADAEGLLVFDER